MLMPTPLEVLPARLWHRLQALLAKVQSQIFGAAVHPVRAVYAHLRLESLAISFSSSK
jgi:hypothetical protein